MGLFMKDGKVKSPLMIISFTMSLLFIVIFVLAYMLPAILLSGPVTGSFWEVWLGPSAAALLACGICCLFMIPFQDKRVVPVAFLFFIAYFLVLGLFYRVDEADRLIARQMMLMYLLPPTVLGNLMSWGIYWLIRRKNQPKRTKSSAC